MTTDLDALQSLLDAATPGEAYQPEDGAALARAAFVALSDLLAEIRHLRGVTTPEMKTPDVVSILCRLGLHKRRAIGHKVNGGHSRAFMWRCARCDWVRVKG